MSNRPQKSHTVHRRGALAGLLAAAVGALSARRREGRRRRGAAGPRAKSGKKPGPEPPIWIGHL